MTIRKLGRLPAVHTLRSMKSALVLAHALSALGPPPPNSVDYTSAVARQSPGGWQMFGNDKWGCCVPADDAHTLMLRTANVGTIVVPTEADVLNRYARLTGFAYTDATDNGTNESVDCMDLVNNGFLGHKADATGMVDPHNLDWLRWCILIFGSVKLGVSIYEADEQQFDHGEPWKLRGDSGQCLGGHDIPLVRYYSDDTFEAVTWGRTQPVEGSWVLNRADEAHALLFEDFMEAGGTTPAGFNLQQCRDDLRQLTL